MNEQENMQTPEPSLLEILLPSFTRKLDDSGCLDLTDSIAAEAYQGCGEYVMAINPDNGAIHEVCSGAEDGCYMGGLTDKCEEVFDAFAHKSASEGYIPVTCMFSHWKACYIELYFVDEAYEGLVQELNECDLTRLKRFEPKTEQLEMPFVKSLQSVLITKVSFEKVITTLEAVTGFTKYHIESLPRGEVIGIYNDYAGITGTVEVIT
jgi:hypothetical protein